MTEIADPLIRVWHDLLARPSGPFALRFLLQPLTAAALAVRDGCRDARSGRSPYLWTILRDPAQRRARLGDGLRAVSRVLGLGVLLDCAYQWLALGAFHPGELLIVAFGLAFVPYLLMRGPAGRIAARCGMRPPGGPLKPPKEAR